MYKFSFIILLFSIVMTQQQYCNLYDINDTSFLSSRNYYELGDTLSLEDQNYDHTICYSDGNYDAGSMFRLSEYSGNIILISMNATW